MKYFIILIIFLISFLDADIKIIASPKCKVEALSIHDVKNIFMIKKKVIDEENIIVIDNSNKETYKKFIKIYLKKSLRKIKVYWTRMLFTGKKIPPKKLSFDELNALDLNTSCYISYVELEKKPLDWNILLIK